MANKYISKQMKHLGLVLDESLKWPPHIKHAKSQAKQSKWSPGKIKILHLM